MEDLIHDFSKSTAFFREDINNNNEFGTPTISIDMLNDDCLINIFGYLPIIDRVRVEKVCKRWQSVARQSWYSFKKFNQYGKLWGLPQRNEQIMRDVDAIHAVLQRCGIFLRNLEFIGYIDELLKVGEQIGLLCPNLQMVDLAGASKEIIKNLADNCNDIRHFCLRDTIHPCDAELSLLFTRNKKLKSIEFICEQVPSSGKFLLDLPTESVERLVVLNSNFPAKYFNEAIRKLKNLTKLSFDFCENFDDETMKAIASNNTLQELQTGHWLGNITSLYPLTNLSHLKVVEFSLCSYINDKFLIALSKHCREISDVNISGCTSITDAGIVAISALPKLEILNVASNWKITDNAFNPMPNLRNLDLYKCKNLTNKSFSYIIETSEKLEILNACYCKLSNPTIKIALNAMKSRKNNITLKIYVRGTRVRLRKIKETSPLLKLLFIRMQYEAKNYV